jgi:hypothetical protein
MLIILLQEHGWFSTGLSEDRNAAQEDPLHKAASEAQAKMDAFREEGLSRLKSCLDPKGGILLESAGIPLPPHHPSP